jgi:hypothetical protein
MGGIVQMVTGGTSPAEFSTVIVMVPIVVIMLWGSNFIGRMQEEEWKQKFERESKVVLKFAKPAIVLSALVSATLSRIK